MAIWRGKTAVPSTGPGAHFEWKFLGGLNSSYLDNATTALGLARTMIDAMKVKMANGYGQLDDSTKAVMNYYFVLGGSEPDSFSDMFTIVGMIANGLNGEGLKIKITNKVGYLGYVNAHGSEGKLKNHWTKGTRQGNSVARGAIHVDTNRFDTTNELSAKTIIHEASHKFASTADFGEKGYTDDDDNTFRATGLTKAEALNNAESYARFVMMSYTGEAPPT